MIRTGSNLGFLVTQSVSDLFHYLVLDLISINNSKVPKLFLYQSINFLLSFFASVTFIIE